MWESGTCGARLRFGNRAAGSPKAGTDRPHSTGSPHRSGSPQAGPRQPTDSSGHRQGSGKSQAAQRQGRAQSGHRHSLCIASRTVRVRVAFFLRVCDAILLELTELAKTVKMPRLRCTAVQRRNSTVRSATARHTAGKARAAQRQAGHRQATALVSPGAWHCSLTCDRRSMF